MIKKLLRQKDDALVVNIDHPSDSLAHVLVRLGVPCIFIDCEQASVDFEKVERIARIAKLSGASSVARLWSSENWLIERMLLRGIDGVVIPRVENAEAVRNVIEAVRYVAQERFDEIAIIIQIECKEAVENIDAILACDEVDCFFIGPVDLSKSLGHGGKFTPEIRTQVDSLIDLITGKGKAVGVLVNETNIADYRKRGVTFCYCHVNDFLRVGISSFR